MSRSGQGNETWYRLQRWKKGQAAAEGLAAQILLSEGFQSVDPSHPLGGPDGLRDVICTRDGRRWIGAAFFPTDKRTFSIIKRKFEDDFKGVETNNVEAFAFVTNQEIKLEQREVLTQIASTKGGLVEIYHLERITTILNSPKCYGLRLEYLDIDMSKEEQIAFFAIRDETVVSMQKQVTEALDKLQKAISDPHFNRTSIASEINEIRNSLAPFFEDSSRQSIYSILNNNFFGPPIFTLSQLEALVEQLTSFEQVLPSVNEQLRSLRTNLKSVIGEQAPLLAALNTGLLGRDVTVSQAKKELLSYEAVLNRVLEKQKLLRDSMSSQSKHINLTDELGSE